MIIYFGGGDNTTQNFYIGWYIGICQLRSISRYTMGEKYIDDCTAEGNEYELLTFYPYESEYGDFYK